MKKIFFIAVFFCAYSICNAQTNADKALEKLTTAILLEDRGEYKEALTLILAAEKLDNKNIDITYEKAYCYYIQGDYKNAIIVLERIVSNPKATDQYYQLLGNSYDNEFKHDKAISVYKNGLAKNEKSGILYAEIGKVYLGKKDAIRALNYFEKGIQVDPYYASNYYNAAKLFCASDNKIWGLLYGEIFMNMERGSKRTLEMSKLLFDTYKQGFIFTPNKPVAVNFTQEELKDNLKHDSDLPYTYANRLEKILLAASNGYDAINIATLTSIRQNVLNKYVEMYTKRYPNILFAYQQQMNTAKVFEAYNYWLFNQGNESEMKTWADAHKEEFALFLTWFKEHPLEISDTHHFHRMDY
jgi:tetratricopeptide (TPR) repeat protein